MWFVIIAILMSLGSGHLRGYWQEEKGVCPANFTAVSSFNKTASIKPWYRSAEEKADAVHLGGGRDL